MGRYCPIHSSADATNAILAVVGYDFRFALK
jgi:hypothetical protein